MTTSSDRRRAILAFIQSRAEIDAPPPTLDEIAKACGFKSRSAVQRYVKELQARGDLEVTPRKARSARPKRAKEQPAGAVALLEIAPRDIQDLTDADLRTLVARLCMADLAIANLPATCVIWGGDQRAPDGGIDVRVKTDPDSRIPRPLSGGSVGIQVKDTRMKGADIQREMCPGGVLRPSIRALIEARGVYIIAASDLVADEEYQRRLEAMAAAASSLDVPAETFDYYDARRLADWTNQHPGVVAWLRSRLGRPLQGWQPFVAWSAPAAGAATFLADQKLRLADPLDPENKLSLVDGLGRIRRILLTPGTSVRLTGLSGVGKTRFAQALFEESAAPGALAEELAVYTDTADSPTPSPQAVLDELLAAQRRAILIIDNCGSQLHNQLSARCKTSGRVSLLTIEYDIREQLASETNVFQLDAGSDELIEHVLEQRFPHISKVNQRTIARFAEGNSRVAIALAQTMERQDSLAGLNDDELINRLFWLGKEINNDLKVAAEACSLVYSFDVEDVDGDDDGELARLGALVDLKSLTLYRHVADLEHRGLAQKRGRWRAILPHAVANPLAERALARVPGRLIERHLVKGPERLLKSFSRRLGYLHKVQQAIDLVRNWLAPDGMLGDLSALDDLHLDVFENIAPVDPAATLEAIKRTVDRPSGENLLASNSTTRRRLVQIIRLIAFDNDLFDACMLLLLQFALREPTDKRDEPTSGVIKSLFQMYLSGTHASTERRAAWVKAMLASDDGTTRTIGLGALSAALECHQCSSHYSFDFGAHMRDYGASPRRAEARAWISTFIGVAVDTATGGGPMAGDVRNALARHFRSLWSFAGAWEPLEDAVEALLPGGWERGWLAIRQTLAFDGKGLPPESRDRLLRLEARTHPSTLVGQVKAIVLSEHFAGVNFSDGHDSPSRGYENALERARELGELVAVDDRAFAEVAPLVVANVHGRQGPFGRGLACGAASVEVMWSALVAAFEALPVDQRNIQVLQGFLNETHERNADLFNRFLDESMTRTALVEWVPVLQLSADLDDRGCERLLASMNNPAVPAWVFRYLGFGRATRRVPEHLIVQMLERLSIKSGGLPIAIDILHMHIFGENVPIGPELTACARILVANAPLTRQDHDLDYALGQLIARFLTGLDARPAAEQILVRVRNAIDDYTLSRYDLSETLKALFAAQPMLSLDALVGDEEKGIDEDYVRRSTLAGGRRFGALASIPEDALLEWCRARGSQRWVRIAPLVPAFDSQIPGGELMWSSVVKVLLTHAPEPGAVAETLIDVLVPTSWSGSRADAIRERLPLLDQLAKILGPTYAEDVAQWRRRVMEIVEHEARRELQEHRVRNERFE